MGRKITRLVVEGVKRVLAVDIEPAGNVIELTGQNEQGKTTILDSIWWAFEGKRHIQEDPINRGRKSALTRIELDDGMVVTRTYKRKDPDDEGSELFTTSVRVEIDGVSQDRPQEDVLNRLIGPIAFDPLEFIRLPADQQFRMLRRFVPEIDFEGVKLSNERDYNKRRDINRDVKALEARVEAIRLPDVIADAKDEAGLLARLEAASKANEAVALHSERKTNLQRRVTAAETAKQRLREEKATAERKLKDLERDLEEAGFELEDAQEDFAKAGEPPTAVDTTSIRAEIAAARQHNEAVSEIHRKVSDHRELSRAAEIKTMESDALTKAIEDRKAAVAKAIADATLPVAGLTFDEEGQIFMNGLPFAQASGAVQLKTSIAIAAAMNPGLSVILVRDGSRLDDAAMDALRWFADANDVQIWIETVSKGKPNAILIEAGRIGDQP
jgi:DNA repair exonuclease SbcCD ATPase subunit